MTIDTVNDLPRRNQYVASPSQDEFDYTFPIFTDADLVVEVDGTVQALDTDYTVAGEGDDAGGTITFTTPLAGDEVVTIYSDLAIERVTDFQQNGPLAADSFNDQFDRLTLIARELKDRVNRSIRFPMSATQSSDDLELSPLSAWRGKLLGVSSDDELEPVTLTDGSAVSLSILSALLWPESDEEDTANRTPSSVPNPLVIHPARYGAVGDGSTDDTVALQACFDVAAEMPFGVIDLAGKNYKCGRVKLDASNVKIMNGKLTAIAGLEAGAAIVYSLAGGADEAVNQALLTAINATMTVRTNVAGSLENVVFENVQFVGNGSAIRGVHFTGFTRGCKMESCYFSNIDGDAICINGSWSFSLISNYVEGDGTNGTGISLGRTGNGERSGAIVCNSVRLMGNEVTGCANGCIWNFGAGGSVVGNTWESNVTDGFASQSVIGIVYAGNYHENNGGDNLQMGGTNGADFAEDWLVAGNYFNASTGNNIRLNGCIRCRVGPNSFSGAQTQWYHIAAGVGQYITDCDILIPAISSTYVSNVETEVYAGANNFHNARNIPTVNTQNGNYTFTRADGARSVDKASGAAGETYTIDSNANLPVPIGTKLRGRNRGGGTLTIACTSDTLHLVGGTSTGSRTVADGGDWLAEKVDTTLWDVSGPGVT